MVIQIFLTFLKLGLTSFGGPVAHIGFFHNEFVVRKKWISEQDYADLVALCQILPGPASSQVGMGIGYYRGGMAGSLLAWTAFTLPSALLLVVFALTLNSLTNLLGEGWLHGLKIAAVAVVAQAVWEMGKKFSLSFSKAALTIIAAACVFYFRELWMQILAIGIGAICGILFFKPELSTPNALTQVSYNYRMSSLFLVTFFILLATLPVAAASLNSLSMTIANIFYRAGALVFGGGHVVLPLIQSSVVDAGMITKESFIAGYGAAQAVPGPLFTFSAYLGFIIDQWNGAIVALVMIFLPSLLLVIGVLPFWETIRSYSKMKAALVGINAVVVGILLAALYDPVWVTAIFTWKDFILAAAAFSILTFKKAPSYLVVIVLAMITALPFY